MTTELGRRLRQARSEAKLNQAKVASLVGIAQSTYQELESGKSKKSAYLPEIASVLGVNVEWLLGMNTATKTDAPLHNILEKSHKPVLNGGNNKQEVEGYFCVDVVKTLVGFDDQGCRSFNYEPTGEVFSFSPQFFREKNVEPDLVRMFKASNDANHPYVAKNDLFMIDTSDVVIRDGESYLVYFEGEIFLRKIDKQQGQTLVLCARNKANYSDKIVDATNSESFQVLGRQFWRAG